MKCMTVYTVYTVLILSMPYEYIAHMSVPVFICEFQKKHYDSKDIWIYWNEKFIHTQDEMVGYYEKLQKIQVYHINSKIESYE